MRDPVDIARKVANESYRFPLVLLPNLIFLIDLIWFDLAASCPTFQRHAPKVSAEVGKSQTKLADNKRQWPTQTRDRRRLIVDRKVLSPVPLSCGCDCRKVIRP